MAMGEGTHLLQLHLTTRLPGFKGAAFGRALLGSADSAELSRGERRKRGRVTERVEGCRWDCGARDRRAGKWRKFGTCTWVTPSSLRTLMIK